MNWSTRPALIAVSCAVAGVIAAGALTAVAYAGSPSRGADNLHGCVTTRTGALRVVDPQRGGKCRSRGPFREYAITLSQAAGLPGPAGPRGPRGPAGDGIDSLDALEGLPCNVGTEDEGQVSITIASPQQGSGVRMICETDGTVLTPPPPTPTAAPTPIPPTTSPIDEGVPDPEPTPVPPTSGPEPTSGPPTAVS